jgi:pimeloyl-ACP methyl ester carboxylesterase
MAIDFIWHGLSSSPDFSEGSAGEDIHWLRQFTLQILELMDHLSMPKVALEGESLGGWIALDMAINFPERVSSIVLNTAWGISLDPNIVPEGVTDLEALKATSLSALENPTDEALRKRLEWLMPLGGVTEELVQLRKALWSREPTRSALKQYYERLFAPDIATYYFDEAAIKTIKCPTLVLWTDKNPIHGPEAAQRLHEIIQDSQLHIMEGCAHWPQWERPQEHDSVINAFISSLGNQADR